jgi:DHA1 family bicyclomycin/chloramphenicol resistance-like MFS transporter
MSLAAAVILIAPQLANAHTPVTLAAGLWLMLLAYGIHQPCGHVGMAMPFPLQAGAASALGGFIFAGAAFLCGAWMGIMYRGGSAAVLSLTTGVLVAAVGVIALTLVQRHGRPIAAQPVAP